MAGMEYLLPPDKAARLKEIRGADTTELAEEIALLRLIAEQQAHEGQNLATVQTASAIGRLAERNLQMQIVDRRLISAEQVGALMSWTADLLFATIKRFLPQAEACECADLFRSEWGRGFAQFKTTGKIPLVAEPQLALPGPEQAEDRPATSPAMVTARSSK